MLLLWKHVTVAASAKINWLTAAPDPPLWLVTLMSDSEPPGLLNRFFFCQVENKNCHPGSKWVSIDIVPRDRFSPSAPLLSHTLTFTIVDSVKALNTHMKNSSMCVLLYSFPEMCNLPLSASNKFGVCLMQKCLKKKQQNRWQGVT